MFVCLKKEDIAKATVNAVEEIDNYIAGLPDAGKAVCEKLRTVIRFAVPEITEEWKWGPHYSYYGMVCGFSAFKKHAKLTFFNGSGMKDPEGIFNHCVDNEFSRSVKFTEVSEINEKLLADYVRESAEINKQGFKRVVADKTVAVPEDLQHALNGNKAACTFFEHLTYGYKKEFVEWINTAKQDKTRTERIAKTVEKCASGERLHDKYKK